MRNFFEACFYPPRTALRFFGLKPLGLSGRASTCSTSPSTHWLGSPRKVKQVSSSGQNVANQVMAN